jgi:hypothetical protein
MRMSHKVYPDVEVVITRFIVLILIYSIRASWLQLCFSFFVPWLQGPLEQHNTNS